MVTKLFYLTSSLKGCPVWGPGEGAWGGGSLAGTRSGGLWMGWRTELGLSGPSIPIVDFSPENNNKKKKKSIYFLQRIISLTYFACFISFIM